MNNFKQQYLNQSIDPLAGIDEAFSHLVEKRQISKSDAITGCTSYVQRKLQCGYNRAAALLDEMVRRGWLTEADEDGARRIVRR